VVLSQDRVLNIKRRLILGTLIAFGVATASAIITFPTVAIELDTDVRIQTVEAHEGIAEVEKTAPQKTLATNVGTEAKVRSYFADIPIMAEVARCESGFTHIDPATGDVKHGHLNYQDIGVMQINERYHGAVSKKMGLNIYDLEGNLAYARYLYEREGTRPWNASKGCWHTDLIAMR
jgi:hypothetical protein